MNVNGTEINTTAGVLAAAGIRTITCTCGEVYQLEGDEPAQPTMPSCVICATLRKPRGNDMQIGFSAMLDVAAPAMNYASKSAPYQNLNT